MFNFHTAVILPVVTVILLLSCTTQGIVENSTKQQNHNHHHIIKEKILLQQQQFHQSHHKSHHLHLHRRHHPHHTTPSLESTTFNPTATNDEGDNESTFKTDSELGKSILTSTTSTPSKHQALSYHQKHLPISSTSRQPSNKNAEHHSFKEHDIPTRLVTAPMPPQHPLLISPKTQHHNHSDGDHHQIRSSSSTASINPLDNSKYSSNIDATDRNIFLFHRLAGSRAMMHMDYNYDLEKQQQLHRLQTPEEDYYEDYNDDDDVGEDDDDDDVDSFIDDNDNNLSDRSYARITRSKLDNDYIDDEPYRNAIEDEMQRDAPPGVLTEQKYMDVGNEKAVQQARERFIQEQKRPKTPHELATEHWQRMIHATKCRKPLPRVIPVSNNTSKRYEPYATILHRCGEDTGCCGTTASVCTVKRYEVVMVYVFSYDFNYRKEIEALPMQNHTECHCVNRASLQQDVAPRGKRSGESWQNQQHYLSRPHRLYAKLLHRPLENTLNCQCPRHFKVYEDEVERYAHLPQPHTVMTRKCRCDCHHNNKTCLRFKNGEEGFSLEDRRCIMEHNCKPPNCSFGSYHAQSGRCPTSKVHSIGQSL